MRTWRHKYYEKKKFLENEKLLIRKLDSDIEPLTNSFSIYSHKRAELIELTIKLWSYLQLAGGMFHAIDPKFGIIFNPEQQGVDGEGSNLIKQTPRRKLSCGLNVVDSATERRALTGY